MKPIAGLSAPTVTSHGFFLGALAAGGSWNPSTATGGSSIVWTRLVRPMRAADCARRLAYPVLAACLLLGAALAHADGPLATVAPLRVQLRGRVMSSDKKYWFRAGRVGWGWGLPCCWQGWAYFIPWLAMLVASGLLLMPGRPLAFVAVLVVMSGVHVLVCFTKGEPPPTPYSPVWNSKPWRGER